MLRNGYTTGSCMTAAACAAYRALKTAERPASIELRLPGGGTLAVPVAEVRPGFAAVVKDGGDDPDVTTGHRVEVAVEPFDGVPDPRDYSDGNLVLTAGSGVGVATRPGLAVPVGKWAINPGPRRMLRDNLRPERRMRITVSVPDGEALAAETLNPTLGVKGGISILGTSGIVRPYSNAAYAATVALQFRSLAASGFTVGATATGSRTAAALRRDYPELAPQGVVEIADFIHVAVRAAASAGLEKLIVGCMPGKLFKYACGEKNTHARKNRLLMGRLAELNVPLPAGVDPARFESMGELKAALAPEAYRAVLEALKPLALRVLRGWGGALPVELALYNEKGERL